MASNLQHLRKTTMGERRQTFLANLLSSSRMRPGSPTWSTEAHYDFELVDDDLSKNASTQLEPSRDSQVTVPAGTANLSSPHRTSALYSSQPDEKGSREVATFGEDGTCDEGSQLTLYGPRSANPTPLASCDSAKFIASVMEAYRFSQHRRLYLPNTEAAIPCRLEKGAYETMEIPPQAAQVPRLKARKPRKTIHYDLDVERYM